MPAENTTRPVQLQVNTNGAWKTVLPFDAGDLNAVALVLQGALLLHQAAPNNSFRISTRDSQPMLLRSLSKSTNGLWADSQGGF